MENFILSTGSKFIKNEINCNLKKKYASAFVSGVINISNSQQHEIKNLIKNIIGLKEWI